NVTIETPLVPIVANVHARAVSEPEVIRSLLVEQVTRSVRWRESVEWMAGEGVTEFWEIGAGKALSGMIRRIAKEAESRAIATPEDVAAAKG
ncbi:MAG: ACP S-malonyltransferase, partial [Rhodobacteraceae bacterium]|nr:ACP S-malonyltransferase [Paracoccaceae bacterium]